MRNARPPAPISTRHATRHAGPPAGARALAVGVVLVTALSGCSTAIRGYAQPADPVAAATSTTPTPAPTPGPDTGIDTGAPTTGRRTLSCHGGTVITAPGGEYCYLVPVGFTDATSEVASSMTDPADSVGLTAVVAGVTRMITVQHIPTSGNNDDRTTAMLLEELKYFVKGGKSEGYTFASTTPTQLAVDGGRGFRYHMSSKKLGLDSDVILVYKAGHQVQIGCHTDVGRQSTIRQACAAVLDSLQILSTTG